MSGGTGIAAANARAAGALISTLAALGVRDACVTPGSRSTPLTAVLARQEEIRPWLHLDERSAAFFALGIARASGRPALLVCTSGTAAANYLPAIAEANLSRVPLIVCTADRPPHLRDVGAPQTIDQVGLYGTHVRWSVDLPCPGGAAHEPAAYSAAATRAVRNATGPLPGPVHLNFPFDEPLIGPPGEHAADAMPAVVSGEYLPGRRPVRPSDADLTEAARRLTDARRPLIVAGPETGGLPAPEIAELADALDAPILADPLSGLRIGAHDRSRVVTAYDALLRDPRASDLRPDAVLRFGAIPTSKALNQYFAHSDIREHVLVDLPGGWRDPSSLTTMMVSGDPRSAAAGLREHLGERSSEAGWTERWLARDRAASTALMQQARSFPEWFEGRVFVELQESLPGGATIVAGNSMPVRDLDSFTVSSDRPLCLVSNRGANGIDGVTSTALGAAAVSSGPVVLVLGDISFLHDLSGLWAARRHGLNLTIVVVNNNGGGIFHYLPQATHEGLFEDWFATPPELSFEHAASLFGARYVCPVDWTEFCAALPRGKEGRFTIIEVLTDREANTSMHHQAWARAAEAAWAEDERA